MNINNKQRITKMKINIDIERMIGSNGKAKVYIPEVHYEIDDMDYVDMNEMNILKSKIQDVVEDGIHNAWLAEHLNDSH